MSVARRAVQWVGDIDVKAALNARSCSCANIPLNAKRVTRGSFDRLSATRRVLSANVNARVPTPLRHWPTRPPPRPIFSIAARADGPRAVGLLG